MSVPARRKSSSKTKKGRSHLSIKKTKLIKCSKCGKAVIPHNACSFCGNYKGKEKIKIKSKTDKKKK